MCNASSTADVAMDCAAGPGATYGTLTDVLKNNAANGAGATTGNGYVHARVSTFPADAAVVGQLVSFSLVNSVGVLVNSTSITDADGIAIVQVNPGSVSGAGSVVAGATVGNSQVSGSVNFASAGDAQPIPFPFTISTMVCDDMPDLVPTACDPAGTFALPITAS